MKHNYVKFCATTPMENHKPQTVKYILQHYCIVLYCIMRPYTYTEGRLDRYRIDISRELSEIRTQP